MGGGRECTVSETSLTPDIYTVLYTRKNLGIMRLGYYMYHNACTRLYAVHTVMDATCYSPLLGGCYVYDNYYSTNKV